MSSVQALEQRHVDWTVPMDTQVVMSTALQDDIGICSLMWGLWYCHVRWTWTHPAFCEIKMDGASGHPGRDEHSASRWHLLPHVKPLIDCRRSRLRSMDIYLDTSNLLWGQNWWYEPRQLYKIDFMRSTVVQDRMIRRSAFSLLMWGDWHLQPHMRMIAMFSYLFEIFSNILLCM